MIEKFKWESIAHSYGELTERAKVLGGWIIKVTLLDEDEGYGSVSQIFISDPNHEWEVDINNL